MAVNKEKPEPVTYSAEELAEIERIVGSLPGSTEESSDGTLMSLNADTSADPSLQSDNTDYLTQDNEDLEDLALEPDSLIEEEAFESEEYDMDDSSDNVNLNADDLSALPELDDSSISFDLDEQEPFDTESDAPFDLEEEISDDGIPSLPDEDISLDSFDDINTDLSSGEGIDELGAGFDLSGADEDAVSGLDDGSMMDQLNDLTADEGDSVDLDDLAEDEFLSSESGSAGGGIEDSVSIEGDDELSLPDLNSLDMDDSASIEEGDLTELPDVGFDDLDSDSIADDTGEAGDFLDQDIDLGLDDLGDDIGELPDIDQTDGGSSDDIGNFDDMDDIGAMPEDEDIESSSTLDDLEQVGVDDPDMSSGLDIDMPEIEPVDDHVTSGGISGSKSGDSLELSTDELNKIKKSLLLYPAGLTAAVKDTILNDRLSPRDTRRVVDMILEGRPDHNIHRFLEKKLGKVIDIEHGGGKRRVILSRPEYSSEGRARQKILLRRTRNIGIGIVLIAVLSAVGYRTLYIPYRANSLIAKGTALIRRHNEPKFPDYKEAEQIFQLIHDEYIPNYIRAYNEYGRAYFDRKQYMESLLKLNRGYELVSDNFTGEDSIQLLNNLGYFYSSNKGAKFDDFFNKSIKKNLDEWYFTKLSRLDVVNNQYDLAIDFYKKALSRNSKNMQALLGIGDVYMNQGEFLKARTYYENILKIDPDSVAGHSGLFNLFVERDNFPEAISVYVNLRNKGMLENVPSPLLAKGANYFLSKAKSDKQNIRIDYGIESPRLKDINDQPFPVVVELLKALRNRDPDYPPLYTAYARLSIKEGNFRLAKEYLENGMKRSEKQGYSYFAGNHLLGVYYYYTRQPALSFKHFRQALVDYSNPPEYSFESYYKETENPGNTSAMLGNIFYYFFDRVQYKTGDQEMMTEMDLRKNEELMGNFNIAKSYYEKALGMGFESPELHYNLGRIYYLNGEYSRTRDQWLNLYDEFTVSPELMLGLGNVFYKMGNYEAAKAQFMKLTSVYEYEAESIYQVVPDNREHKKIFQTLATAYNNLGAVYQQQNILDQSAICYWNSIELSRKIGEESAFARVNLGRGVKEREIPAEPVFDDNIPYSIEYYAEEMRWSR